MIEVRFSTIDDMSGWIRLAKQVEHLFGPMVDDSSFHQALMVAISDRRAFCASEAGPKGGGLLQGGIVVSTEENEILWFAVEEESRGRGIGKALMHKALGSLDPGRPMKVTTFDESAEAGISARRLYEKHGFRDSRSAGLNPAGIPIVEMVRPGNAERVPEE
jgi:ribosomal protein S18 acetylase RimI-like enzyme